jgi:hypothetical protein
MPSMRTLIFFVSICFAAVGCGGASDDGSKAKLAADLVACKNEQLTLKEQLAQAKVDLEKAQQAAGATKLGAVDLKARAAGGPTSKEGNVSPDEVMKVVRQNSGGLRACYEHALKRKPDLQYVSTVTAHFSLKSTGNVSNVSFVPHTDAEMERCMASAMEKWHFPAFEGASVAFEQPVNLVAR